MKHSVFDPHDYKTLVSRIQALNSENRPEWGEMTIEQMLCHCADPIRDLLGIRNPDNLELGSTQRAAIREYLTSEVPFDHSAPTLEVYKQGGEGKGTPPTDFEHDRMLLLDLLDLFSQVPQYQQLQLHPAAGSLSRDQAGIFLWKHTDHHLRQFGA